MPISDEVIELEPVKKSKSKLIIFIVLAGVMFALAITFLILFLVKPGGGGTTSSGKVNNVSVNSSKLFSNSVDGELRHYASVGTEYIVYAAVSVDGDVGNDIKWSCSPYNALAKSAEGEDENGKYFKFTPNADFPENTLVTITAASSSNNEIKETIEFYIVKQGTEHIKFLSYNRGANATSATAVPISGAEITVPSYAKPTNNEKFTVTLDQFGAYNSSLGADDPDAYAALTLNDGFCNFEVTSSDESVIAIKRDDIVQKSATDMPKFSFNVLKMSDKPITLTVKANSAVATLTVKIESNSKLGYIEKIYIADRPIGTDDAAKAFYKKLAEAGDQADWHNVKDIGVNWLSDVSKNNVLTIPYMASYNNILSHVVISPLSLQYDATKNEILTDWRKMIGVTVDQSSLVKDAVAINNGTITGRNLANKNDCILSFADSTRNAIASSAAKIKLAVVAQNTEGSISVKVGSTEYDSKAISGLNSKEEGIPVSTGNEATMFVSYALNAPASADPDKMLSSGYITPKFRITVEYIGSETGANNGLSIKVGTTDIKSGEIYSYSTAMTVTHGTGQQFTGVAPVKISVKAGALKGKYRLTYEKVGTQLDGVTNNLDQSWDEQVCFEVTPIATSARFVSAVEGNKLLDNNKVGKFIPAADGGSAELYVQNRESSNSSWSITQFIDVNGAADFTVKAQSLISNNQSRLLNGTLTSDNKIQFYGRKTQIDATRKELRIDISVYPQGNTKVLQQFTVNVFVVDAVTELKCANENAETKAYGGTADAWLSISKESIKAAYEFSGSNLTYDTQNFALGFAANVDDKNSFVLFEEVTTNLGDGVIGYKVKDKPDADILFTYSGGVFTQKADLFAYSKQYGINLSHIKVRYYMNEFDIKNGFYRVDDPSGIFAERTYIFERKADDIRLFTLASCTGESAIKFDPSGTGTFKLDANIGSTVHVYASPIVYCNGDSSDPTVVYSSENNNKNLRLIAHEKAFIKVDKNFGIIAESSGRVTEYDDEYDGGDLYYYFTASVPNVSLGESKIFELPVWRGDRQSKMVLNVTVNNKAKPVNALNICKVDDSDNNTETSLTKLEFVNSNASKRNDWYTKKFCVKVSYAAGSGTYNYYEPFTVNIPACFDVTIDGAAATPQIKDGIATYTIEPDGTPNDGAMSQTYRFVLTLKTDATAMSNGKAIAKSAASGKNSNEAAVIIGVGLSNIKFTVNDVEYAANENAVPVGIKFADNQTGKTQAVSIPLKYETLGGEDYTAIAYDFDSLSKTLGSNVSFVDNKLIITLPADTANGKTTYTATFTDKAFCEAGAAGKTFTISLEVTVSHDVYALSTGAVSVTTTGESGDATSNSVSVSYNNGDSNYAPTIDASALDVALVWRSGNSGAYTYEDYNNTTVSIATGGNSFTFTVPNSLTNGAVDNKQLCVKVSYGSVVTYSPVTVTTTAIGVRRADGIAVTDGKATVKIASANENKFKLAAEAYNLGSGEAAGNAVTYSLHSDPARTKAINGISIDASGNITFTAPDTFSGTVYYRASSGGKNYDVDIAYSVAIASVELTGLGNVLSGTKLTLYYVDSTHYTSLDLTDHITVKSVLSGMTAQPDATFTLTSENNALDISTYTIAPKSTGAKKLTVKAECGGTAVSADYSVDVVGLTFDIDKTADTLDVTNAAGSVSFAYTASDKLSGDLTINYDTAKFTINGDTTKTVTLNRSAFGANDYDKAYDIVVKYVFALTSTDLQVYGGELAISKTFKLTVTNGYTFDGFDLKDGDNTIVPSSSITVAVGDTYTISVPYESSFVSSNVTSSRTDIANVSFAGGTATVTPTGNAFGAVTITVKVTAYGKTITREQTYTFADGVGITASLKGSSSADVTSGSTVNIDYAGTAAPTFTYSLAVSNATVNADNVHFTWSGNVAAAEDKANKSVTFTVAKPTTLTVIGYVEVNGRRYYGAEYKVTFAATAPAFALNVDKTTIQPNEQATFSVSRATGFKGDTNTEYAIVDADATVATIDKSTGVLTPKPQRTDDRAVVVRATVTVNGGAFAGEKYMLEKSVTIKGVPLPTVSVKGQNIKFAINTQYDLNDLFDVSGGNATFTFSTNTPNHTYADGDLITFAPADACGYKFEITAKVTVAADQPNAGATPSATLVCYIDPAAAAASDYAIDEGRIGSYDIKNAISITTGTADGAFKSGDEYTVEFYGDTPDGITVSGSTVTLADNILGSDTQLTLSAKVTITSGTHTGAIINVNDVVITIKAVPQYTVTFDSGVAPQTVMKGGKADRPADPVQDGKIFTGWRKSGETSDYNFDTPVTGDISLVAQWRDIMYTVTFDGMGGTIAGDPTVSVIHGGTVTAPTAPTKTGYTFGGWHMDTACTNSYDFDTAVEYSFTLYAKWTPVEYTVTFDSKGGSAVNSATVAHGDKVVRPVDPTMVGHTFGGWYTDAECANAYDFGAAAGSAFTLYAKWTKNSYTVTFKFNDGTTADSKVENVEHDTTLAEDRIPNDPSRTGYTFDGWYLNGVKYTVEAVKGFKVIDNVTFVAQWTKNAYEVKFVDSDGTTEIYTQTIVYGGKVVEPKDPTKVGYTFTGWKKQGESSYYNFDTTVTEDITLEAQWTPNSYAVTFDSMGGSSVESASVVHGDKATAPTAPTKTGYTFGGWFKAGETTAFDFDTEITSDITLVAHWTTAVYTVAFDSDNGTDAINVSVSHNNTVARPVDPTKDGFTFDGWFEKNEAGDLVDTAFDFSQGITGNVNLYAKWTEDTSAE